MRDNMTIKKMYFIKNIILPFFLVGTFVASTLYGNSPITFFGGDTLADSEEPNEIDDDFYLEPTSAEKLAPSPIIKNSSVFLPDILSYDKGEFIDKEYEQLPVLNNDVEYQALGESVYPNINGNTVRAYPLYGYAKTAYNNPNVALGIMLFETIQYKIIHPEEKINVSFASYRISPTVAVCVKPQSRYYGYMRALYDKDYDGWGFVRVAYLLVECARMGIEVDILGQLNSYSVYQYGANGKISKRSEPSFVEYFQAALDTDCYTCFAPDCKVSDFMNFCKVDWNLSDKGGSDMMHLKLLATTAHIDESGLEHHNSIFMSSSNLDTIDYRGWNGLNCDQSGLVITDHEYLYRCTFNYVRLCMQYAHQEGMYELKNIINERNTQQVAMINAGRINDIEQNKLIAYSGTPEDNVFECYFTPLGGHAFSWDIVNNPLCKYAMLMGNSDDSVTFCLNNARVETGFDLYKNLHDILYNKFVTKKNPNNRINISGYAFETSDIDALVAGVDVAFKNCKYGGSMHAKDMMFSYVDSESDERQFVSLFTTCNFHSGAYYYQTNSFIVVHENENMSNLFYNHFGVTSSRGAILYEGLRAAKDERYISSDPLLSLPKTISATIKLRKEELHDVQGGGAIFGDNNHWSKCYDYFIDVDGHPQIFYRAQDKAGAEKTITFDNVDVATGKFINLTITRNSSTIDCYVDGVLKQSITNTIPTLYSPERRFVFNGNWRSGNRHFFRGITKDLKLFSDPVTPGQISSGSANNSLMCNFDFTLWNNRTTDLSKKLGTLIYDKMWQRDVLDPDDYDYSIAQIGDTQILSENHQDKLAKMYDWMVDNKEKYKISFMVGMGDITNKAWSWEYEYDKEQIYKLNGSIPYILCRGDHDKLNKTNKPAPNISVNFNDVFNDDYYPSSIDGQYKTGDLTNTYKCIKLGDIDYLFLCLDVGAPDDVLEWANNVCSANQDKRIVVSTHVYLYRDGTTLDYNDAYCPKAANGYNSGEQIWQKLVSINKNIDYVLCGHDPCDVIIIRDSVNGDDHVVRQILSNQQDVDAAVGPTGMVTLHFFKNDGTLVAIRNYATGFEKFGSISSNINYI